MSLDPWEKLLFGRKYSISSEKSLEVGHPICGTMDTPTPLNVALDALIIAVRGFILERSHEVEALPDWLFRGADESANDDHKHFHEFLKPLEGPERDAYCGSLNVVSDVFRPKGNGGL